MQTMCFFLQKNGCGEAGDKIPAIKMKFSLDKGPVMLLNEIYPNASYALVSESGEQFNKYTTCLTIKDHK